MRTLRYRNFVGKQTGSRRYWQFTTWSDSPIFQFDTSVSFPHLNMCRFESRRLLIFFFSFFFFLFLCNLKLDCKKSYCRYRNMMIKFVVKLTWSAALRHVVPLYCTIGWKLFWRSYDLQVMHLIIWYSPKVIIYYYTHATITHSWLETILEY